MSRSSWLAAQRGASPARARAVLFTTEEERLKARNAFWPYRLRERVVGYGTADVADEPERQIEALYARLPRLADRRFVLFLKPDPPEEGL